MTVYLPPFRLLWYDKRQFKRYMSILVDVREVPYLVNFMHGYLGLCVDNTNPFSQGSGQADYNAFQVYIAGIF